MIYRNYRLLRHHPKTTLARNSRRSPDTTASQPDLSCTTPVNGALLGGGSNPPSPSKSTGSAVGPRSPTRASSQSVAGAGAAPAGAAGEPPTHNYETTFDLDGNVETASLGSSRDGRRSVIALAS